MNISSLVMAHMPQFWIHSKEIYHSMSIKTYLEFYAETYENDTRVRIVNPSCKYGIKNTLQIIANIVEHTVDGLHVCDFVYYCFFPHSGPIGIFNKGEHMYDMEHVTLRFIDKTIDQLTVVNTIQETSHPDFVLFSIHSKDKWIPFCGTEVVNNRINVYVAKGGHAMYPKAGTYWRYFGFANDVCDMGYTCHNPDILIYDSSSPIFKYKSVADGDDGRNWNKRQLYEGETVSYDNSIKTYCFT